MFEGIKSFLRRVRSVMFDKGTIKNAIREDIAMSDKMAQAIKLWADMYVNGGTLNLPASISGEMARLVSVELKSVITGSTRANFLNKKYTEVVEGIRTPLEYGCAKGGLIFKPYVSGSEISVDYIHADSFFPLQFDNNRRCICGADCEGYNVLYTPGTSRAERKNICYIKQSLPEPERRHFGE